ncbi:uncharacterized protein L969DRAFT_70805 [Mixia osmundae IAM 14324]|uniref:uncharacterized protein n=1 Tax=Mixia osmundae (strain CBS 9802 / IAM 14324 / JCM 22182 / KY 12970) TaxID=764103 RepID=UPI0004A553DF|nr:uncharacterized protein L969DRAFT_70805 [Mixia osmundae IAM 14324]KEI41332.1 hypothetical protein L969DRAFT_70805 [Mixia osmundae IAM 14324]
MDSLSHEQARVQTGDRPIDVPSIDASSPPAPSASHLLPAPPNAVSLAPVAGRAAGARPEISNVAAAGTVTPSGSETAPMSAKSNLSTLSSGAGMQVLASMKLAQAAASSTKLSGTSSGSPQEEKTLKRLEVAFTEKAIEPAPVQHKLILEKYVLYETKMHFYLVATNQSDTRYRVLKIDRRFDASRVDLQEDDVIYTEQEKDSLLRSLEEGNKNAGGLHRLPTPYYGIVGFIRFTAGWYLVLVKKRSAVALLGGHYIYHCDDTSTVSISPAVKPDRPSEEQRLLNIFQQVDLSKNFYFSYTYDVTNMLQVNMTMPAHRACREDDVPATAWGYNDKFIWNRFLLEGGFSNRFERSHWVLPLLYGFIDQAKVSIFGQNVFITLFARRSRHFAGARFLKRGVNEDGYVANDVETEQIVSKLSTTPFFTVTKEIEPATGRITYLRKASPDYTSWVQHRGSIPLSWSQETTGMTPRPPIDINIIDPYFVAGAKHFNDLMSRYSAPIIVLSLIKGGRHREAKLAPEFSECIRYLNQFLPAGKCIEYVPFDMAGSHKRPGIDSLSVLEDIAEEALEKTQFFHSGGEPIAYAYSNDEDAPTYRPVPLMQTGICRTNCIDCLDRTNACQFILGRSVLGHQLRALGVYKGTTLEFDSDATNLLTEMYHDHGDTLALQYGGSHLVNTMETYRKINQWSSHSRDMIEGLKRYYSNSFVDADKQTAINLFLGIDTQVLLRLAHRNKGLRKSYQQWFDRRFVDGSTREAALSRLLDQSLRDDIDYWIEYYRPKVVTFVQRHFAYKVNSTLKYSPSARFSGDQLDESPFTKRKNIEQPHIKALGGTRQWMSTASRDNVNDKRKSRGGKGELGDTEAEPMRVLPPASTTEGLALRLLAPVVEPQEGDEYERYVHQFAHLSLSQDLQRSQDLSVYRRACQISKGVESAFETQYDVYKASTSVVVI